MFNALKAMLDKKKQIEKNKLNKKKQQLYLKI